MLRYYAYLANSQHWEIRLPKLIPWGQLRNEHYMLTCISVSGYAIHEDLCTMSKYHGQWQLFTFHKYCGKYLLVPATLDPSPHLVKCRNTPKCHQAAFMKEKFPAIIPRVYHIQHKQYKIYHSTMIVCLYYWAAGWAVLVCREQPWHMASYTGITIKMGQIIMAVINWQGKTVVT